MLGAPTGWVVLALAALVVRSATVGRAVEGYDPTLLTASAQALFQQRTYTRVDGLPSNEIRALLVARDGVLWIGTGGGLVRYDGREFTTFDHTRCPEFVSDKVNAIAEGADGTLWVGTGEGLLRFNRQGVRRYTTSEGLESNEVWILAAARNGDVWLGTTGAVQRLQGEERFQTWTGVFRPLQDDGSCIRSIVEDQDGEVRFVGVYDGIHRFNRITSEIEPETSPWPAPHHLRGDAMVLGPWGEVWLSAGIGWARHTIGDGWQWLDSLNGLGDQMGLVRCADSLGNLWATEWDAGVRVSRGSLRRLYTPSDGLTGTPVTSVVEDRQGGIWIGTWHGLNRWLPRRLSPISVEQGLPSDTVWTVAPAANGSVWAGTQAGLARVSREGTVQVVPNLPNPRVRSVLEDPARGLWIGGLSSLEFWRDGVVSRPPPMETPDRTLRVIGADRAGRVWIGQSEGLFHLEAGTWRHFTTKDGLPLNEIRAIHGDRRGRLWLGTPGRGVAVARIAEDPVRLREVTVLSAAEGLPSTFVRCLYEDTRHLLWVGTERGLARVEADDDLRTAPNAPYRVRAITREHGLAFDAINTMVEDDLGQLWVGTDSGICRLSLADLNAVADGRTNRVPCLAYTMADGLPAVGTSGPRSQPSSAKTEDGRLWFATPAGIVRIDPRTIDTLEVPAIPRVERVRAAGKVLFETQPGAPSANGLHFPIGPGGASSLEVYFDATTFRSGGDTRFRYRLHGFDPDWVDADARRVALYTLLPPGRYRFEVAAAVNHSLWSLEPAVTTFSIAPRWHERIIVRVAAVGMVGVGLFYVQRRREQRKQRLAELERLVAIGNERQRIARDLHDDLGAGLTRLSMLGARARRTVTEPTVATSLDRVVGEAGRLVDELGDLVWATDPGFDSLSALLARLREHAASFLRDAGVAGRLDFPSHAPDCQVTGETRRHLTLAFKEALTNAVRHAAATRVEVTARFDDGALEFVVADNGRGLPADWHQPVGNANGNGLRNLRTRLGKVGGTCLLEPNGDSGTRIILRAPLPRR